MSNQEESNKKPVLRGEIFTSKNSIIYILLICSILSQAYLIYRYSILEKQLSETNQLIKDNNEYLTGKIKDIDNTVDEINDNIYSIYLEF